VNGPSGQSQTPIGSASSFAAEASCFSKSRAR